MSPGFRRSSATLIDWVAADGAPTFLARGAPLRKREIRCLWAGGFIANRAELLAKVEYSDVSDSGLIESLYRTAGSRVAEGIAGPFSFVLWDGRKRRLVAVADRAGVHRLHFRRRTGGLAIADSVEALLDARSSTATLDRTAIAIHLAGGHVPLARSFFAGIESLEPGHVLCAGEREVRVSPYWRLETKGTLRLASDRAYAEVLWPVLRDVVAEYAVDGPAAVALSGGVDSPAIAALLREIDPSAPLLALRIVAPGLGDSERSDEVAKALGLEAREVPLEAGFAPFPSGTLPTRRDSPVVPMVAATRDKVIDTMIDSGVRVMFTGWGGDELFGGTFPCYLDLLLTGRWLDLAVQLRRHVGESGPGAAARAFLRPIIEPLRPSVRKWRSPPVPWLRRDYRRLAVKAASEVPRRPRTLPGRRDRWSRLGAVGPVRAIEPLVRACHDRSVELRNPLGDHRLREFALSLPAEQTYRSGATKHVLRKALCERLPVELVSRLGKSLAGFLTFDALRGRDSEAVWKLLTDMRAADLGFVDQQRLRRHYGEFLAGKNDDVVFWHTLTFESWLRQHF